MADVSKTVAIIFQGQDQTSGALASVEKSLGAIHTEAGGAAPKVAELGNQIDDLGKKGAGVEGLITSLKALGAGLVVNAFIDANVAAERFELTMKTLTGSNTAAGTEMDYVKGVANKLGLELFSTADAYSALYASTKGTALAGQETRDIFEAVARAMAALGKSSSDTEGALLAISQMISKGTVSAEELRGQLGERLPGAFQAAASAMGMTTGDLDKFIATGKLAATDFLPKFADELNKTFGGAEFDTYTGNLNRLKNSLSEAFLVIGESGTFDALIKGVQAGSAAIVGATQVATLLGTVLEGVFLKLAGGANFNFGDYLATALDKAADKSRAARDALLGVDETAKQAGDSGAVAGGKIEEGMTRAALSADALKKAAAEIDKSLKALGIDPKIFADPIKEIEAAFDSLTKNAAASGEQILTGLIGALQRMPAGASLRPLAQDIDEAFKNGKLTADQFGVALELLKVKMSGAAPSFEPVTEASKKQSEALKKTADEAKRVEENAAKMKLELEKLASNERIKTMEANVKLNVAQVEADTKRIEAAFASINNTINSTGTVLGGLFAMFGKEGELSFSALSDIRDQIGIENRMREEAFKLQKELTEAQIAEMKARTAAMNSGQALIKIDGAGLKPHLEAFMWEILKAIQVRVNAQGLGMLLGV